MEVQPKHGYAVASLVLGICSIVFCCCTYVGIIVGIIGLVLAIVARKAGNEESICKAGLICSIVGLSLSIILLVISLIVAGSPAYQQMLDKLQQQAR